MRVFATRLGTRLSITIIDRGSGWRFGSWSTVADHPPAVQPERGDRARCLAEVGEALAEFRARYGDVADA